MPALAGEAVELDERELYLLMPAITMLLVFASPEDAGDEVHLALDDIEQVVLARGAGVGHRGLCSERSSHRRWAPALADAEAPACTAGPAYRTPYAPPTPFAFCTTWQRCWEATA